MDFNSDVEPIIVYKNRTTTLPVSLGFNVAADTFTSQIRERPTASSPLIVSWVVSFLTDGSDGELVLVIDNSVASAITQRTGYMDIRRLSGGEPLPVFDKPIPVNFVEAVTV